MWMLLLPSKVKHTTNAINSIQYSDAAAVNAVLAVQLAAAPAAVHAVDHAVDVVCSYTTNN